MEGRKEEKNEGRNKSKKREMNIGRKEERIE